MQGENKALSAGSSYDLMCEVVGSRPTPVITWWKGSILMRNTSDTVSLKKNNFLQYTYVILHYRMAMRM